MAKKKKRPERKKLLEAGKFAKELLVERGFELPKDQSAVDRILQTRGGPTLPGIPAYLPFPWTINAARRILYDLAREWELKNKNDAGAINNITEFFQFIVRVLRDEEHELNVKLDVTVRLKQYDFKILHQKDAIKGIRKLLVDSFAVAIIAKSNDDVSNYLDWFREWSDHLLNQWGKNIQKIK